MSSALLTLQTIGFILRTPTTETQQLLPNKHFSIREGDIFKIGRVAFRVRKIKDGCTQGKFLEDSLVMNIKSELKLNRKQSAQEEKNCRYCLSDEDEDSNPLINICKCTGSARWTHLKCLLEWINKKMTVKRSKNLIYVSYRKYCEICMARLPSTILKSESKRRRTGV